MWAVAHCVRKGANPSCTSRLAMPRRIHPGSTQSSSVFRLVSVHSRYRSAWQRVRSLACPVFLALSVTLLLHFQPLSLLLQAEDFRLDFIVRLLPRRLLVLVLTVVPSSFRSSLPCPVPRVWATAAALEQGLGSRAICPVLSPAVRFPPP